ncbi:unnamed protein product [Urochloa decumbens]|uniref:F-box domain-containing protein n=1 Tax=Urochloa decumbens TaxID=240449 RepID=A0ABC8WXR4_9POAL
MSDVVSLRKQTSPAELADDLPVLPDTRTEILLRVPPQPRSLQRVSHVCRSWRRLVTDPRFLRSFRALHNGTPPLVGVFHSNIYEGVRRFTPTAGDDPMPARVFDCPAHWRVLDSRHGRVLCLAMARDATASAMLVVWDPITRMCEHIQMPPDLVVYDYGKLGGAVVCRAGGGGNGEGRHGDCRSGPFQVVLLIGRAPRALVSVYSSHTGGWSEVISFDGLPEWADVMPTPGAVIRNTLYHPVFGCHTLAFDLDSKAFAMIPHPPEAKWMDVQVMRLDGGRLGLVVADIFDFSLQLWAREDAGDWVLRWTVQLDTLEPLKAAAAAQPGAGDLRDVKLIGACDYGNVIFLWTRLGSFMFYLDTMELKKLPYDSTMMLGGTLYPYESFFAPLQATTPN